MAKKFNQSAPGSSSAPESSPPISGIGRRGLVEVVETTELTPEEERERLHLERKVERAFYEAGKALQELRDKRLYRNTHRTFEEYCRDRFDFTRRHPYRLIEAALVVDNLAEKCVQFGHILPTREAQVRPLTPLEPPQQCEVWEQAVEAAGGKVPPGRVVKDIVQRIKDRIPVPNPYQVGDICQILARDNPELRGKGGCWALVLSAAEFGCTVRIWNGECHVRVENLQRLDLLPAQKQEVERLSERLIQLQGFGPLDRSAQYLLARFGKQTYLTEVEEKLLQTLEEYYGVG